MCREPVIVYPKKKKLTIFGLLNFAVLGPFFAEMRELTPVSGSVAQFLPLRWFHLDGCIFFPVEWFAACPVFARVRFFKSLSVKGSDPFSKAVNGIDASHFQEFGDLVDINHLAVIITNVRKLFYFDPNPLFFGLFSVPAPLSASPARERGFFVR